MSISVYKIDNHLVITGDTKSIRNNLKDFNGRWVPAPFNFWLIPDMKRKSFIRNKDILAKVNIEGIEKESKIKSTKKVKVNEEKKIKGVNEEKEKMTEKKEEIKKETIQELSNLNILPKDIIKEIINHVDDESISSLLSVTKQLSELKPDYQQQINKQALKRELKHVTTKRRTYYKDIIPDFKVGDRVYYEHENYKITMMNKNKGEMIHVDTAGNVMYGSKPKELQIIKHEFFNGRIYTHEFIWASDKKRVIPGILLFDYGPVIQNMNSIYLKYKVLSTNEHNPFPEENEMILVNFDNRQHGIGYTYDREYYVSKLDKNEMILKYVHGTEHISHNTYLEPELLAIKENLRWKIVNDHYTIVKIGGFGEKTHEFIPR